VASPGDQLVLGTIVLFPYKEAVVGWAKTNGANIPIAQHEALHSVMYMPTVIDDPWPGGFPLPYFDPPPFAADGIDSRDWASFQICLNGVYPDFWDGYAQGV
jgi:hypothetical protein